MVFARAVSRVEMGVYGAVNLALWMLMIVGSLGLSFSASRFIPHFFGRGDHGRVWRVSKRILTVSVASALAFFLVLSTLSDVFSLWLLATTDYAHLFAIAAAITFTGILGFVLSGFLQGLQRFRALALFRLSSQVLRVGVSTALLWLGFGVAAVFIGWATFYAVLTVLASVSVAGMLFKTRGSGDNPDGNYFPFRVLFGFSLPMMVYQLVTYLSNSIDRFVVLGFLGSESLGVYTVVTTAVSSIHTTLVLPLSATMIPSMSQVYARVGVDRVSEAFRLSSRYISLMFIPACAGFAVLSPLAIGILAGSRYIEAGLPLSIVSVGLIVHGLSTALLSALVALGKTSRVALAVLLASSVGLALSILLVPLLGVVGAALSRTLMYLSMFGLLILLGSKLMVIRVDQNTAWKSGVSSAVMVSLLFPLAWTTGYKLVFLPLYLLSGASAYGLILASLGTLTLADIRFLARIIPRGEKLFYGAEKFVKKSSLLLRFSKWVLRGHTSP